MELHSFAQCVVPLAPKRFGRALSAGKGVLVCARFSAPANALWKICEPGYSCVIGKKAVLLGACCSDPTDDAAVALALLLVVRDL